MLSAHVNSGVNPIGGDSFNDRDKMTKESCQDYCRERKFAYAGVYRTICYCGNRVPDQRLIGSWYDCDQSCSGDATESGGCGGSYKLNLYKV